MRSQASEFREDRGGCRLHPCPVGLCKMDCQQGHLDLLVVKCLPSWKELKKTFEEDLASWWGRKILLKRPFRLIGLLHSWGMEEPEKLTRPVWIALFSHCWFSMWKDRIIKLVIEEASNLKLIQLLTGGSAAVWDSHSIANAYYR